MFEEREQELPLNHIVTIHLEDSRIVHSSTEELPRDAFSEEPLEVDPFTAERKEYEAREEGERPRRGKIHPQLIRRLNERPAADYREQILITLRDDMTLPRFPARAIYEPRESETNRAVMQRTEELIREITNRRADNYERVIRELSESYEYVEVLETYWLINALLVDMPLAAVYGLARREDVLSVEPRYKELQDLPLEQPVESYYVFGVRVPRPGTQLVGSAIDPNVVDVWVPRPGVHVSPSELDPNRGTVRYARNVINSDAYFSHVPESNRGWMAIFDSGVRFTHQILSNPSVIGERRDCVRGGDDCNTGPNLNPKDVRDHGTSAAAIICANPNQGDKYRGVTRIRLDSWRIITEPGNPEEPPAMNSGAVLKAFENAVRLRYLVISQSTGAPQTNDLDSASQAADAAFDAGGVATIAGVGNTPGSNTAHAPANAHKAIGVGAFDVLDRITYSNQSRGPTRDGRIKPDIQAPTNTVTASGDSDDGRRWFSGTSGAAPYAASVAVLARAFLGKGTSFAIGPGHVYAYLILSTVLPIGDPTVQIQPGPFKPPLVPEPVSWVNNKTGAGHLRMDTGGLRWVGSVSITDNAVIDIPLEMGGGDFRVLDAALWWPEERPSAEGEVHNDIDLILVSPSGVQSAFSKQTLSVFERARVEEVGHLQHGPWKLRIHGYRVPGGSQTVFYAASAGFG